MTTRRFSAKPQTTQRDLVNLMNKINATSLKIETRDLLNPDDVRATIQFDRAGKRYISTCDRWESYNDNLRAAYWAIEYTWRIGEAYGVEMDEEDLLESIFAALEAPLDPGILMLGDGSEVWYEVLGVTPDASKAAIVNAFRALSKVHHPDAGGKPADFVRLQQAYEDGLIMAGHHD